MEGSESRPENQSVEGGSSQKRNGHAGKMQPRHASSSKQGSKELSIVTGLPSPAPGGPLPLEQLLPLGEQALLALLQAGGTPGSAPPNLLNPSALGLLASLFSQIAPNTMPLASTPSGATGETSITSEDPGAGPGGDSEQGQAKRKRSVRAAPDPDAEVVALSPSSLMATNKFICDICGKEFQRDQNLQLHRRGHNVPWKLKQRAVPESPPKKRVYICPEPTCVHHDPTKALGDLGGIKKHYFRKHGEKRFKCENCSKRYAVEVDWKAHMKTCKRREYQCDCKLRLAASRYPQGHWSGHDHGHDHPCGGFFSAAEGQAQASEHHH